MKKISPSPAGIPQEILCSADLSNRPPGLSAMEFLTAQYELGRGIDSELTRRLKTATSGPTASATASLADRFSKFLTTGSLDRELSQADARRLLDMSRAALLARPSATATPSPAPAPATTTALEFEGPPLKMTRTEFDKMSPAGKSKFSTSGGRIV